MGKSMVSSILMITSGWFERTLKLSALKSFSISNSGNRNLDKLLFVAWMSHCINSPVFPPDGFTTSRIASNPSVEFGFNPMTTWSEIVLSGLSTTIENVGVEKDESVIG
jgi:hypothetical protein